MPPQDTLRHVFDRYYAKHSPKVWASSMIAVFISHGFMRSGSQLTIHLTLPSFLQYFALLGNWCLYLIGVYGTLYNETQKLKQLRHWESATQIPGTCKRLGRSIILLAHIALFFGMYHAVAEHKNALLLQLWATNLFLNFGLHVVPLERRLHVGEPSAQANWSYVNFAAALVASAICFTQTIPDEGFYMPTILLMIVVGAVDGIQNKRFYAESMIRMLDDGGK